MKRFILLILLLPVLSFAQELNATVKVNYEQLPNQVKDRLLGFERAVSDYLNNNKFSEQVWEYEKIKCTFNIFFTSGSEDFRYKAQVVVTSQRAIYQSTRRSLMMSVMDNSWDFVYEKNQAMYFNPMDFDALTSFLDFYAYIIIGFDSDSYGPDPDGGAEYFNRALDIALRGASSRYSEGWIAESTSYNRRGLVEDLLNASYSQFRHDFMHYHFDGLDIIEKDRIRGQKAMVKMIKNLADRKDKLNPRSVLLKTFFDAKAGEIVDNLKDYPDKSIFEKLKRINPANISKYDQALK